MEYIVMIVLVGALSVLIARYLKVKSQIKNITRQLSDNKVRRNSISIELFDKEIETLALSINHLIEENSNMVLEAEKNNHYLKSSIADISHDMRTPLTSSIGYMQLLGRSDLEDEQRRYLDISLDKSQHLRTLLSKFFELSALSANDTEVDFKKIDVAGVVSEVILDHSSEFAQKGIRPIFSMSDNPVFILGDIQKMQRIVQNLISNCLKYSCGDVVFTICEADTVKLTIQNPVSHSQQIDVERIFSRFYKADVSRNEQGTGLGLSITRLLVEKLGGSVTAYLADNSIAIHLEFPRYLF